MWYKVEGFVWKPCSLNSIKNWSFKFEMTNYVPCWNCHLHARGKVFVVVVVEVGLDGEVLLVTAAKVDPRHQNETPQNCGKEEIAERTHLIWFVSTLKTFKCKLSATNTFVEHFNPKLFLQTQLAVTSVPRQVINCNFRRPTSYSCVL